MKLSVARRWSSTVRKIFSGLREKLFDHDACFENKQKLTKKIFLNYGVLGSGYLPYSTLGGGIAFVASDFRFESRRFEVWPCPPAVFLEKKLYSKLSLSTQVYRLLLVNYCREEPCYGQASRPIASCYGSQDKFSEWLMNELPRHSSRNLRILFIPVQFLPSPVYPAEHSHP